MSIALAPNLHQLQLSPDSTVRLRGLAWSDYVQILTEFGTDRIIRITYTQGLLEIRMPGSRHEVLNRLLELIVNVLGAGFGQNLRSFGSTTLNREDLAHGVEPDSCFYLEQADRVVESVSGLLVPDLEAPDLVAPDLVVEVDIASSSKLRLPVYREMGVAEIWLYRKEKLEVLVLGRDGYEGEIASRAFPQVTAIELNQWLELGIKLGNLPLILQVQQFCQAIAQ
jgi:Uma2 family endonuclease